MGEKKRKLSASLEDYLEAIFNISGKSDVARSKQIADHLGVARPSVTSALKILKSKGLVNYEPYGYITLTTAGIESASRIARKHNVLHLFFADILGIDSETAHEAACNAEHGLGADVISKLLLFTEFATQKDEKGNNLSVRFKNFCEEHSQTTSESNRLTISAEKEVL